jgi:hypothetical protein
MGVGAVEEEGEFSPLPTDMWGPLTAH